MVRSKKALAAWMTALPIALAGAGEASALDLAGAWATSADQCDKVFQRRGRAVKFTDLSDVYGGGFIVSGDQMTGKSARCKIKKRKDDGATTNIVAACASDIMLSTVQFSLRQEGEDTIVRLFPGMEDMEIRYHRCAAFKP